MQGTINGISIFLKTHCAREKNIYSMLTGVVHRVQCTYYLFFLLATCQEEKRSLTSTTYGIKLSTQPFLNALCLENKQTILLTVF